VSTAFYTALSTLHANEMGIDVAGNNLANMSTPGYKAVVLDFTEMMSQTSGSGDSQVGMGVALPTTRRIFSQGTLQPNSGLLTAGIQGDGFFTIQTAGGETLYTRDGNFKLSKQGVLQTQSGDTVLGTKGAIVVPTDNLPPTETKNMTLSANLDASADASASGAFSTPIQVVDSLGNTHILTMTFTKTASNTWSYSASSDVSGATTTGSGTLSFDTNGKLVSPSPTSATVSITNLGNGAGDMSINWDLLASDGVTPTITQTTGTSACSAQWQDGSTMATLQQVSIGDGGYVVGEYSNGQSVQLAQLQLSSIRNPDTLIDAGNNAFRTSAATAAPVKGLPGAGGIGTVVGGQLEGSKVDIATEFTNLIVYQRGYQAGARVVTTADQLTQTTINMMQG
jgi:flagellar hook protein FlgE